MKGRLVSQILEIYFLILANFSQDYDPLPVSRFDITQINFYEQFIVIHTLAPALSVCLFRIFTYFTLHIVYR